MRRIVLLWCLGSSIASGQTVSEKQRTFIYEGAEPLPNVRIDGEAVRIHTQGLFVTDTHYLTTGRLETKPKRALLLSFDRSDLEKYEHTDITPEVVNGETLDHPGGFDVAADGTCWIPLSTSHRKGPSKICQYEIGTTLGDWRLLNSFAVDDHIGAVCCLKDNLIVGANWDTKDIYVWKPSGEQASRTKQSETLSRGKQQVAVQDWKRLAPDSSIAIAGGLEKMPGGSRATVMIADLLGGDVLEIHQFARREGVSRPITNEGLAVRDGRLYLLPEDIGHGAKVLRYRMATTD